jgi:hypothetical protein
MASIERTETDGEGSSEGSALPGHPTIVDLLSLDLPTRIRNSLLRHRAKIERRMGLETTVSREHLLGGCNIGPTALAAIERALLGALEAGHEFGAIGGTIVADTDEEFVLALRTCFGDLRFRDSRQEDVFLRRIKGETLAEIGAIYGVTRERIRQIESRLVRRYSNRARSMLGVLWERSARRVIAEFVARTGGIIPEDDVASWLQLEPHGFALLRRLISGEGQDEESSELDFSGGSVSVLGDSTTLRNLVREAIGPTGIMRLGDAVMTLRRLRPDLRVLDSGSPEEVEALLANAGAWEAIEASPSEAMMSDVWVTAGLTRAANRAVRALLYAIGPDGEPTSRTDLVLSWIRSRTGEAVSEQAFDATCDRYPMVFVRTGPTSWGLVGAGAAPASIRRGAPSAPGEIIELVTDAVLSAETGLTLEEVITEVREQREDVSAVTIKLYLNYFHSERFVLGPDGRYRIDARYLEHLRSPGARPSTIDILTQVVRDAAAPLSVDEIIAMCESVAFVDRSAIRGYLSNNYGGRFRKLTDGRYVSA